LNKWQPIGVELPTHPVIEMNGIGLTEQQIISKAILHTYDIRYDDAIFRNKPADFEKLRGDYRTRREFPAYTIKAKNVNRETLVNLKKMGFNVFIRPVRLKKPDRS
jgi:erythronate-4-phosphate dehydrogenase